MFHETRYLTGVDVIVQWFDLEGKVKGIAVVVLTVLTSSVPHSAIRSQS